MPRALAITHALRVAASWLLVVCVFFGPAGLGGSAAFAAVTKPCGISCPCDEVVGDADADPGDEPGEAAPRRDTDEPIDDDPSDDEPGEDECPDDCPSCGCCLGVAMAVLSFPATSFTTSCSSLRALAPVDAPASGAQTGVFRPPRSST
ncbi:hypothetical protein [Paraliomyxa miuraensis]|uniref:hypothetical protein n=1 Tax=Paraliomyxa miuraensis TaxID=376150 RepID=UPI002250A24E|nr:hypothetical protein [Paraliomyxa miuraensis]MCX4242581.1 hypothetical protein [Paraliomyxa miuraensis]